MAEQTITDGFGEEIGAEASTTPEEVEDQSAVQSTDEQPEGQEEAEGSEDQTGELQPETDEDLDYWKSKGVDPKSPDALKQAAQLARKAEGEFTRQRQNEKQLKQEVQGQYSQELSAQAQQGQLSQLDQIAIRQQYQDNRQNVSDFLAEVNATPEEQERIVDYMRSDITLRDGTVVKGYDLYVSGALSLKKIYQMTGGGAIDPKAIQEQTRKQTLAEISNKQRAQRLAGGSTDSKQFSAGDSDDDFLAGFSEA